MSEKKYDYLVKQWNKDKENVIVIDERAIKVIDDCFNNYIQKIKEGSLTLDEYTNRVSNMEVGGCDYLCTFIENKSSKFYGSASAGNANYFGIKKNEDGATYYISKKVSENNVENKKASRDDAEKLFKKEGGVLENLKNISTENLSDKIDANIVKYVENNNCISSYVMLRKIVAMNNVGSFLYIYKDEAIDIIYDFFIGNNTDNKITNIEKNFEITKKLKQIFNVIEDQNIKFETIRLTYFIWSIFGSTISLEAKNMILHGAPGTGKTYKVKNTVKNIILKQGGNIEEQLIFTQFHPSYGYEDFIDGIKPTGFTKNEQLKLELKNGNFKELCRKATISLKNARIKGTEPLDFFFVADEINRAELSRVFGELLISIEEDYRIDFDKEGHILKEENLITTQNSTLDTKPVFEKNNKSFFGVPVNLFFIGTMNDIDRSVDSFDMALRRRFYWKELRCDYDYLEKRHDYNEDFITICKNLNEYITGYKEEKNNDKLVKINKVKNMNPLRLGTSFEIGHAYFNNVKISKKGINELWISKLEPLLKEYLRSEYSQDQINEKLINAKQIFTLPDKKNNDTNS